MKSRFIHGVSYFGRTTTRAQFKPFGIKQDDRLLHIYVIGKTGTGKSTLLETLITQDIRFYRGCCLVDPHGDLVERIYASIPRERRRETIYLDAPNSHQTFGYNPLRHVRADKRPLAASGLLEVFKKTWADAWGVRMEHVMRNAILALLEARGSTMPDLLRILTDDTFRKEIAAQVSNQTVQNFWLKQYPRYSTSMKSDLVGVIQNKVDAFLAYPTIRKILTEPENHISFRRAMDSRQVVLINLAKGLIGEDASSLLGGMLVTTIGLAAYSRADIHESLRRPFYLYVDEFQNFTTLSFVGGLLSEARKFKLALCIANQFLDQVEPGVRHAVLGNAGTIISFRVGPKDAGLLVKEFQPSNLEAVDLLMLPNRKVYLKLMIDGEPAKPFSAQTIQSHEPQLIWKEKLKEEAKRYEPKKELPPAYRISDFY